MSQALRASIRLIILLNLHGEKIAKFIIKIIKFPILFLINLTYKPRSTYQRKKKFVKRKAELIKEYKYEEILEKEKELNHLKNKIREQKNYSNETLKSTPYKRQYIWLDIAQNSHSKHENPRYQLWKRNLLQHIFWL